MALAGYAFGFTSKSKRNNEKENLKKDIILKGNSAYFKSSGEEFGPRGWIE